MSILCSEEALWQLDWDVPHLLVIEWVNNVSPQEAVVPVIRVVGSKELNTEVLECSFFIALVLWRLRGQTKPARCPARNWTFASAKLLDCYLTQSLFKTAPTNLAVSVLPLGGMGGFKWLTKLAGAELCKQLLSCATPHGSRYQQEIFPHRGCFYLWTSG